MNKILTGTIQVPESGRSQLIYSSQVYNTHFNVFAEFENNGRLVTQMNFDFINYTGPINLGIVEIGKLTLKTTNSSNFFILPITLQGMPEAIENKKVFRNGEFLLDENKTNYLIVTRSLKPLNDGRNSSRPSVYRTNLAPDSTYGDVFDTEFFNRDGIREDSYNSRNRLPKANVQQIINEIDNAAIPAINGKKGEEENNNILGGYRCMYSASKIIIS